ncbi:SdiA-regulated family protein [Inquilinus sp. KBS0705]|nr:SdiA-regulated family protein [Inquilinus sp. KBS0705]
MKKTSVIFCLLIGIIGSSCSQTKKQSAKNPPGYDLNNPVKYNMPAELLEISGIAFNQGDNATIYAEQDEDGNIYSFKPGDTQVKQAKFGKHGDYEDVAVANNYAVILRSDGTLFSFPLAQVAAGQITSINEQKSFLPKGEYEGLHADVFTGKLYALCKQCPGGNHAKECNGYILNLAADGTITQSGEFSIDVKKIIDIAGKGKMKFHPSALAKNPLTKQWYILSSVNKLLVVADENFNVQQAYPLNSGFLQPEGMAFDKQGNLYISNEGDTASPGNISLFKYVKK